MDGLQGQRTPYNGLEKSALSDEAKRKALDETNPEVMMIMMLDEITGRLEDLQPVAVRDYLTELSGGFNSGSLAANASVEVDVLKALQRSATDGYITCASGRILVTINQRDPITLILSQVLDFGLEGNRFWEIERIQIEAGLGAAATFRMLLI